MKSIKKSIGILILVLSLFACDEESTFQKSDIELVSVYALTDISGGNSPFAINIYKTLPLIIEYDSEVTATKFTSASFSDSSTDTMFEFSVAKIVDGDPVGFWIEGDKTTGDGTLTVVTDATEVFNVKIEEKEVYN